MEVLPHRPDIRCARHGIVPHQPSRVVQRVQESTSCESGGGAVTAWGGRVGGLTIPLHPKALDQQQGGGVHVHGRRKQREKRVSVPIE